VTSKAAQLVFVNVETPVKLNTKLALFEKVRKLASGTLAMVIGLLTSTPSPTLKQPGEPKTPDAQPANVRLVLVATSESQMSDPAGQEKFEPPAVGWAAGSLLNVTESMVAVTVPVEPVASVPTTDPDAVGTDKKKAQLSPAAAARACRKFIFTFIFPPTKNSWSKTTSTYSLPGDHECLCLEDAEMGTSKMPVPSTGNTLDTLRILSRFAFPCPSRP